MAIKLKCNFNPADDFGFGELVSKLRKMDSGNYKVFVCDDRPSRSLQQNAYYWAVVIPLMADHLGYTKIECHELFKIQFLPRHQIEVDGKKYSYSQSTRSLNTKQFAEYLEEIIALAVSMDVYIPEAGEVPDEAIIKQY